MSSCDDIAKRLHEWADGELTASVLLDVESHLGSCEDCRRQAESIRSVKRLVQVKGRLVPAPPGLEDRVRAAIARERTGSGSARPPAVLLRWSWVRIAATLVLVAVAGAILQLQRPAAPRFLVHASMAHEALQQHRDGPQNYRPKCAVEVSRYLEGKQLPAELPPFPEQLARVVGVGSSRFGGWCDAVHLRYERVGRPGAFSLFVIPAEIKLGPDERRTMWHNFCLCHRLGENTVICFRRLGTYYSIVLDDPDEDFRQQLLSWGMAPSAGAGAGMMKKDGPGAPGGTATGEPPLDSAPGKTMHDKTASDAPTSDAPTSDAPTSDAPTRDAPTRDAPTRDSPAMEKKGDS